MKQQEPRLFIKGNFIPTFVDSAKRKVNGGVSVV
jgi:hypothetical protein